MAAGMRISSLCGLAAPMLCRSGETLMRGLGTPPTLTGEPKGAGTCSLEVVVEEEEEEAPAS